MDHVTAMGTRTIHTQVRKANTALTMMNIAAWAHALTVTLHSVV
jgi:hypothetical protein